MHLFLNFIHHKGIVFLFTNIYHKSNNRALPRMCLAFLYNFLLHSLLIVYLPFLLHAFFIRKKYRHSLAYRFGIKRVKIDSLGKDCIWIHAVSMGETKAVAPIVERLKKEYPSYYLVVSSTTETGHEEAKKSIPYADKHIYLPIDSYFLVHPLVKQVKPKLLLISETDFWFQFQREVKKYGGKIALVNGKLSEKSLAQYKRFSFFTKALLAGIDSFCLQGRVYQERFEELGVDKSKISITGNTKLDQALLAMEGQELQQWQELLGIKANQEVIVFGSTHEKEELIALDVALKLWVEKPNLKVIIVPRHPERFSKVADLISFKGIPFNSFTQMKKDGPKENLILIDGMGVLQRCYQLATIAVVCGSFTEKVGGHNIFEPLHYGVPAIFGPYMFTQQGAREIVLSQKAGLQVKEKDLFSSIVKLLNDKAFYTQTSKQALSLIESAKGAAGKTMETISTFF